MKFLILLLLPTLSLAKEIKDLTPLQYYVTQENGTEEPFKNQYWNEKRKGIYVDIVSGEALFSSEDKFNSGTGWPSFTKPIDENNISSKSDTLFGMFRTEVRSKKGNSHLGHVFKDGPKAHGGKRYCINSASLEFIPYQEMEQKGYGQWKSTFREELPSQGK